MVCIGDGVVNRSMVVHERANGRWELQSSITHDELGDMGHLVPMKKEVF